MLILLPLVGIDRRKFLGLASQLVQLTWKVSKKSKRCMTPEEWHPGL